MSCIKCGHDPNKIKWRDIIMELFDKYGHHTRINKPAIISMVMVACNTSAQEFTQSNKDLNQFISEACGGINPWLTSYKGKAGGIGLYNPHMADQALAKSTWTL